MRPTGDHFYTASEAERSTAIAAYGYVDEGVACWTPIVQVVGVPLFRLFRGASGDHFYTTSATERDNAIAQYGYTSEGTACHVYSFPGSGRLPLFRALKKYGAVVRLHATIVQYYVSEGIACQVFASPQAGTTPLFRLFRPASGDHLYTISATERDNAIAQHGYNDEGTACHVFLSAQAGTTPLFRLFDAASGDHFYTISAAERDNAIANLGPTVPISTSLSSMRQVYDTVNIKVELHSTRQQSLPDLVDTDVGACVSGSVTAEQTTLFSQRDGMDATDIAIYFVRSTVPPFNGCAAHPGGQPGAVIAAGATQWTMAHEVGHVLGLVHVNNNDRLMTENGTANITNPPPDLIQTEATTMDNSALTLDI